MNCMSFPRYIYVGDQSLDRLSNLSGNNILLIGSKNSQVNCAYFSTIQKEMSRIYGNVESLLLDSHRPFYEVVTQHLPEVLLYQPDWIVAIGESSIIDLAKTLWLLYEHPDLKWKSLHHPIDFDSKAFRSHILSIPLYNDHVNHFIALEQMTPEMVLLDDTLFKELPYDITTLGMMSQWIELFEYSIHEKNNSNKNSLLGVKRYHDLYLSSVEENQIQYSELFLLYMMEKSYVQTIGTPNLFEICEFISTILGTPYSTTLCIFFPYYLEHCNETLQSRYAQSASFFGLSGNHNEDLLHSLVLDIRFMYHQAAIPLSFQEYGLDHEVYQSIYDTLSNTITLQSNYAFNTKDPLQICLREFLSKIYYGDY